MEKTRLLWLRVLTPGVIALAFFPTLDLPFLNFKNATTTFSAWFFVFPLIVILLGFLYHTLGLRDWLLGDFWDDTNSNIRSQLLSILKGDMKINSTQEQYLNENRRLIDSVFYNIIDSDPSLSSKGKSVYLNGYFMTLGVDIAMISIFYMIIHLVMIYRDHDYHILLVVLFFTIAAFAWAYILPLTEKRHKKLSNEQLEVIQNLHTERACENAKKILQQMP